MAFTLAEIAERIGAEIVGDPEAVLRGIGSLEHAGAGDLTHLSSAAYRRFLPGTSATAVILAQGDVAACPTHALVVDNPYHAYAVASALFETRPATEPGVHPHAVVDPSARLGHGVSVAPHAVVMADVELGARVSIGPGACVGAGTIVGADTVILANATLYHGIRLGERCIVHSGAVIGADGFGFAPDTAGRLAAIAQVGGVTIGDDVSIGALSAVDRGAIDDTVIADGVKIDNLVQIGHNCDIGEHTVICGCTGIVGSTRIGRHCILGGGVGVGGDGPVEICDGVTVSAMTHVTGSIDEPGVYSGGTLHGKTRRWKRSALRFAELDSMAKRLARLEKEVGTR